MQERNLACCQASGDEAAKSGARFICLQNVPISWPLTKNHFAGWLKEAGSQSLACLTELAKTHHIFISAGSLMMRTMVRQAGKRSYLVGPDGGILARYDKIHMFDADVGDGKQYRSQSISNPGRK